MNDRDDRDAELRQLAKQLPYERPADTRVDAVRSSLLLAAASAEDHQRSRWYLIGGGFAAGALAAAAVAVIVLRGGSDRPVARPSGDPRASIEASSAADFERGADEVVRIRGGRVSLAGELVRVATGDAHVDGHGRYEVVVTRDGLREVTVREGAATIRLDHQQPIFLAAGETWKATTVIAELQPSTTPIVTPPPPAPAPIAPSTRDTPKVVTATPIKTPPVPHTVDPPTVDPAPVAVTPAPPAPPSTELEQHFAEGMRLLKAGKSAEAARELGIAADTGGNDSLATDARYFQAAALTKAGRKTEAEAALLAFLDHAPHALRRGRAAVMLGRLIAERGDTASAKTWFESARHDADPSVVAAADAALASLGK